MTSCTMCNRFYRYTACAIFAVVKLTQDLTMLSTHGVVLSDRDRELAVTSASQPSHAANSGTLISCFPILSNWRIRESITHELNSPTVSTSNLNCLTLCLRKNPRQLCLPTLSEGNARAFYRCV